MVMRHHELRIWIWDLMWNLQKKGGREGVRKQWKWKVTLIQALLLSQLVSGEAVSRVVLKEGDPRLYHTRLASRKLPVGEIIERGVFAGDLSMGFPGDAVGKNLLANAWDARDVGSVLGSGRAPGEGNGNSFQYSYLENSMDRGAWWATVHGAAKSQTWLSIHAMPTYNSLHLLIPNAQSFPPPPPTLAITSLFSVSVNLFLFCR